jgi:hypothetical protein
MTEVFRIPLQPTPQEFFIELAGVEYLAVCRWNDAPEAGWELSINTADGEPIVTALPLVTGVDLLAQHRHVGIGGALVVYTDADPDATPTLETLGSDSNLYFIAGLDE